tara:strand:+ start:5757 stop:6017 length:261 start_codon:yes stop_codon:yes gene_type:complete
METPENQEATENPTGELNGQQALNVLIQAVRIAQGKGAFTLEDAEIISKAIKIFVPPTPEGEEGTDPVMNEDGVAATEPVMTKVEK